MAKISEALENLEKQQKQERENIYQLHQENLNSLNKNLTELYENKLNTIGNDMLKIVLIALFLALIGGGIMGFWIEKIRIERSNYILQKKDWAYGSDNKREWYIKAKNLKGE